MSLLLLFRKAVAVVFGRPPVRGTSVLIAQEQGWVLIEQNDQTVRISGAALAVSTPPNEQYVSIKPAKSAGTA